MKNLGPHAYEVFQDAADSLWKARNTKTGVITSSNAELTTVLQAAINALTGSRGWIETIKVRGSGILDQVTLPSYTRIDLLDALITQKQHSNPNAVTALFINSDTTGGNVEIEIIGGIIDGNRSQQYPYTGSPPGDEDTANIIQFTKVTNGKVLHCTVNNTPARAVRFRDSVNCIAAYCKSNLANAEAFQSRGGSYSKFLFNHITNSMASFITVHETPNTIIHGNQGYTNTGAALNSGYNISSVGTIFTDNIGYDAGSTILTMSEGSIDHLGSFTLIANNDLSYSRAEGGMTMVSSLPQAGIIIKGNKFHHNVRHGCRVSSTKSGIMIEGNMAYENTQSGISVHSGGGLFPDHVAIHGNFCWNNNTSNSANDYEQCGIAVFSSTAGEFLTNVSIHHNHCWDTRSVVGDKTQIYGILIDDVTNCAVSFNNVVGNKTDGMRITGTNTGLRNFENMGYSATQLLAFTNAANSFSAQQTYRDNLWRIFNPGLNFPYVMRTSAITATRDITLPLLTANDEFVFKDHAVTLTQKTLTSPTMTDPSMSGVVTIPGAVATPLIFRKSVAAGSGQDSIVRFEVEDDASSFFAIENLTGTDGSFVGSMRAKSPGTFTSLLLLGEGTTDSSSNPIVMVRARIGSGTLVANRPLFAVSNLNFSNNVNVWNVTNLQFLDAYDIKLGTTTGTKIGTGATEKIGFWNATPVVQPTAVADATDATTVITQLNALLSRLRTIGLIAAA
jgi:hypothetical protein